MNGDCHADTSSFVSGKAAWRRFKKILQALKHWSFFMAPSLEQRGSFKVLKHWSVEVPSCFQALQAAPARQLEDTSRRYFKHWSCFMAPSFEQRGSFKALKHWSVEALKHLHASKLCKRQGSLKVLQEDTSSIAVLNYLHGSKLWTVRKL